jgi:hypothetical protein
MNVCLLPCDSAGLEILEVGSALKDSGVTHPCAGIGDDHGVEKVGNFSTMKTSLSCK